MIVHGMCVSAKRDFLAGVHAQSDRYMLALYTESADIGPHTTAYTRIGEAVGDGYNPGGIQLRNVKYWSDDTAGYMTFDSVRLKNATITARGALVYNASKQNKALVVIDFGKNYTSTAGPFELQIPADFIAFK